MANAFGIQLRHPIADDLVGARLTIAAIGTAFEASYGWQVKVADAVVKEGFFQAGSMGLMEAFVYEQDLSFTYVGEARFLLFGDDPSGEHQPGVDVAEVPVILIPGMRGYLIHQVVGGDTLTKIAAEHGSTVKHIAAANRILNPDLIRVGQILRVPVSMQ